MLSDDFTVHTWIKNKDMENPSERVQTFVGYCREQKYNLTHILRDIESAFCLLQDGKQKADWSDAAKISFQHIRRDVLNCANNMERLPKAMRCKNVPLDSIPSSDFVAGFFERFEM